MRWVVTLSASQDDVTRLAGGALTEVSRADGEPERLLLQVEDPAGATADPAAAQQAIDDAVRRINGFGRLKWGGAFDGVTIERTQSIDADGRTASYVSLGPATMHMEFEKFADMVERIGHPRPEPPKALAIIRGLDGDDVTALAASNPDVALVLELVDRMLLPREGIDWSAAYTAFEVIEHDLHDRKVHERSRSWWADNEAERLARTANSIEAVGVLSRHGKRYDAPKNPMSARDASWFIRGAVAHWIADLLADRTST